MDEASNNLLWRLVGKLEARMDRAERDIREMNRRHSRDKVKPHELQPYIFGIAALMALAWAKWMLGDKFSEVITLAQTLAGLRGQ